MKEISRDFMKYPASRFSRWMFKAPIYLWRLGLGPILGRYLLILSHIGRRSGHTRHTMVEFHKFGDRVYVPCAFGPQSDWYKNLRADPFVTVQTAKGTQSMAGSRVVDDEELLDVYNLFLRRDPPLTKLYLLSLGIQSNPDDIVRNKERIYWIRFEPVSESSPVPLEVDLAWIWLIVITFLLFMKRPFWKSG